MLGAPELTARSGAGAVVVAILVTLPGCGECDARRFVHAGASDESLVAHLCVERAETEAALRTGLSGRAPLAAGEGLELVFPVEDDLCITNAEVDFAIDAAFVDDEGHIAAIERAIPAHAADDRCHAPTRTVIETRAHELDAVAVGDVVVAGD